MVYRLSWLAGGSAVLLALLRLGRVVRPVEGGGPPWQLVLLAALILAGAVTWTARAYRLGTWTTMGLNLIGLTLVVVRVGAPESAMGGFIPTSATLGALVPEIQVAMELTRYGSAPVVPVAGLVALLVVVAWAMGALLAWGLTGARPALALVPPLLFYLQLATIDRIPPGPAWTVAFLALVVFTLVAVVWDERQLGTGRMRRPRGPTIAPTAGRLPVVMGSITVAATLVGTSWLAPLVADTGTVPWRASGTFGGGIFGGITYNLFVGIRQNLVSQSEEPVFVARVAGDVKPNELYWKLITLDDFNGSTWSPANTAVRQPRPGEPFEIDDERFRGNTSTVEQVVQIVSLRQNYLPAIYSPVDLRTEEELLQRSFRVRPDGSIKYDILSHEGLTYRITSDVPNPTLGELATVDGSLSPIFQEAATAGVFSERAQPVPASPVPPAVLQTMRRLPDELDPRIAEAAQQLTAGASTPFEEASLLEGFFRDSGAFTYSTEISPGHSARNLADWLFSPDSPNYRTGYCEQFATGMAVMARSLQIPARVVLGFTPGDLTEDGLIIVRQKNAHAWVELWLDDLGWVRFDPTPRADDINPATTGAFGFDPRSYLPEAIEGDFPNQPGVPDRMNLEEILRRLGELGFEEGGVPAPTQPVSLPSRVAWVLAAAAAILVLAGLPLVKAVRRRRRLARLADGDITAAWDEIVDRLLDLGRDLPESLTPMELAAATSGAMTPLAQAYGAAVYGPGADLGAGMVEAATSSFRQTSRSLDASHSRRRRLLAWFRLRSLRR